MENEKNPFIPLTPVYRQLLILYFLVYLMIIPFAKLCFIDTSVPDQFSRQLLTFVYNTLLFLPIFFYRSNYGFLHPLLFSTLFELATKLLKAPNQLFSFFDTRPLYDTIFNVALRGWNQFDIAQADIFLKFLEILSLVFYYLGFFYGPSFKNIKFKPAKAPNTWFYVKCLTIIFIALGTMALYLQSKGGIIAHFNVIGDGRGEIRENDGIIFLIIRLGFAAALVLYAFDKELIKKPWFLALLVPILFANFVSQGSRSSIIIAAAAFFVLWMIHNRKIPTGSAIIFGVLTVVLVGVLGEVRRSGQGSAEVNWEILTSFSFDEATTSFYDDIDLREVDKNSTLAVAARGVEDFGLLWGKSYVSFILFWIPRAIWQDKPYAISQYTSIYLYRDTAGRPGSPVAEAYWNFHILGVIVVFFLFGAYHRWLANFFILNSENPVCKCVYVILLLLISAPGAAIILKSLQILVPIFGLLWWVGALGPGLTFGPKKIL